LVLSFSFSAFLSKGEEGRKKRKEKRREGREGRKQNRLYFLHTKKHQSKSLVQMILSDVLFTPVHPIIAE